MECGLLADLYSKSLIQFGEFTLKSGLVSPIYVDLRPLITYREIRDKTANALCTAIKNSGAGFDYVVGVPYGALLLAEAVARSLEKTEIMKRKEAKSYGKKEMLLGHYEQGRRVIVIEDVVTSGASIMETIVDLERAGLKCEHVFCVVDREQGGTERLQQHGLQLHSLIRMNSILEFLAKEGKIDNDKKAVILEQLVVPGHENQTGQLDWDIQTRLPLFADGSLNKRLVEMMLAKKTNLCLAVDDCSKEQIIQIIDKTKSSICALKLHCDTIDGWDMDFALELRRLADSHQFIIFEDRKLADTGNTMQMQLTQGHFRIAEWADVVTIYPQIGVKSIEALKPIIESPKYKLSGFLVLAELSTEQAKIKPEDAVDAAEKLGNTMISGFICQRRCHNDRTFLHWTPGINLAASTDGKGQRWRGPEQAILKDGCDIVIVGRGITKATDIGEEARRYAKAAWKALIGGNY